MTPDAPDKFCWVLPRCDTVLAIVGSRGFSNLELVVEFVSKLKPTTMVISGGARGVDVTAEDAAKARGLVVTSYPAQWEIHGRKAGIMRNAKLVQEATYVVAFWDERSRGTHDTIRRARSAGKLWAVFNEAGKKIA